MLREFSKTRHGPALRLVGDRESRNLIESDKKIVVGTFAHILIPVATCVFKTDEPHLCSLHPFGPTARLASALAELAAFLASDKAGFITGENICIDGGQTRLMIYHGDHGWTLDG